MKYVINALPGGALIGRTFEGRPTDRDSVRRAFYGGVVSAVGHDATAAALSVALGVEVPCARVSITLAPGDMLYVAALRGPRLAEGQVLSAEEVTTRGFDFLAVRILA